MFGRLVEGFPFDKMNHSGVIQEAQLPLRNRASAVHFFVAKLLFIAVMNYYYVHHVRNLRTANLLRTQRINFSMPLQHVDVV